MTKVNGNRASIAHETTGTSAERGLQAEAILQALLLELNGEQPVGAANRRDGKAPRRLPWAPDATMPRPAHLPEPPDSKDLRKKGSLKVNGDSVMTPGGYEIKITAGEGFKVLGPDGKPVVGVGIGGQVSEGDNKNAWRFSKDSRLVLPDGTKITMDTDYNGGGTGPGVRGPPSKEATLENLVITSPGKYRPSVVGIRNLDDRDHGPDISQPNSQSSLGMHEALRRQDRYDERMVRYQVEYGNDKDGINVRRVKKKGGKGRIVKDDGAHPITKNPGGGSFYEPATEPRRTERPSPSTNLPPMSPGSLWEQQPQVAALVALLHRLQALTLPSQGPAAFAPFAPMPWS